MDSDEEARNDELELYPQIANELMGQIDHTININIDMYIDMSYMLFIDDKLLKEKSLEICLHK